MVEMPQVPDGCQVIPLWRNVSGNNWRPVYEIVGYTIVDDVNFQWLNQHRWFMVENRSGDCYAVRYEKQGGKNISILMAREILGLSRNPGRRGDKADHMDHNTLNNRRNNLRPATPSQSQANRRGHSLRQRFQGVSLHGNKYQSHVYSGLNFDFTTVSLEIEAAWMRRYAAIILHDKFAHLEDLPEDEKPSRERRWELFGMVVEKLRKKGWF